MSSSAPRTRNEEARGRAGCSGPSGASYEARLVAGVGVAIQASSRVDVTVSHTYGFDLQE